MRITNNMTMWNLMSNMERNMNAMAGYDYKLATGRKFELPSDDPVGVSKSLKYHTDIAKVEQYNKNLEDGKSWLDATEEAINQVNAIIKRSHELTIQGRNDTYNEDDLKKISAEIKQLKAQLVSTANSSFAGKYIFSGYKTDTKLLDENGYYRLTNYGVGVAGSFDKNILKQSDLSEYNVGTLDKIVVNTIGVNIFGIFEGDLDQGNFQKNAKGYEVNNDLKLCNNRSADKSYMVAVYDELIRTLDTASQHVDRLSGIKAFDAVGANPKEYTVHTVDINTGGIEPNKSSYDPHYARAEAITAASGAKLYVTADEKLKGATGNGIVVNITNSGTADPVATYTPGPPGTLEVNLGGHTVSAYDLSKLINNVEGGGYFKASGDDLNFTPADAGATQTLKDAYDAGNIKLATGQMTAVVSGAQITVTAKAGGRFEGISGNEVQINITNSGFSAGLQAFVEKGYPTVINVDLGGADRTAADIEAVIENINSGKDFDVAVNTAGNFTLTDDVDVTKTTLKGGINANSLIAFEAINGGKDGNEYQVIFEKQDPKEPIKVEVSGNLIRVKLATDANGKSISTANDVIEAITNSYSASQIIRAYNIEGSSGEGVVDTNENMRIDQNATEMSLKYGSDFEAKEEVAAKVQIGQIYQQNKEGARGFITNMVLSNPLQENNAFMYFEVSEIDKTAGTVKLTFKSNQYGKDGKLTTFPDEEITLNAGVANGPFKVGDIEFSNFTLGNIDQFTKGDKASLNVRAAELFNKSEIVIQNGTDDEKSIVVDNKALDYIKDDPDHTGFHEIKAYYIHPDTGVIRPQSFEIQIDKLKQGVTLSIAAKNNTDIKAIAGDHIPPDRSYRLTEKEDVGVGVSTISLEKSYNQQEKDIIDKTTLIVARDAANPANPNIINGSTIFEVVGKEGHQVFMKVRSHNVRTDGKTFLNEEYITLNAKDPLVAGSGTNTVTLNANRAAEERYDVTFDLMEVKNLTLGDKFSIQTTAEATAANQDALIFDTYERDPVTNEDKVETKMSRKIVLDDGLPLDGLQLGAFELNAINGTVDGPRLTLEAKGKIKDGGVTKFSSTKSQKPEDQLDETIGRLQELLNNLLASQADIGAKGNRLDLIQNRLTAENLNFTTLLTKNENIDYAKTILEFKETENVYNASLSVGAKILQPSLLDFIR